MILRNIVKSKSYWGEGTYNKLILSSRNKMKCTWKIIKEEKGTTKNGMDIQSLVIDNNVLTNQNKIANTFNNYFLPIADSINTDINMHIHSDRFNPINYLSNSFIRPISKISWQYASTYEIEKNY